LKELFEASKDKYGDAKKMGTTYQTLTNVIYRSSDIKVSTLEKIAKFYNVPIGYFFDEAEADQLSEQKMEVERIKGQLQGLREALAIFRERPYQTQQQQEQLSPCHPI
jgi:transcriptional regulator with XRE-family HTH domain